MHTTPVKRTGKVTKKYIEGLHSKRIDSVLLCNREFPKALKVWHSFVQGSNYQHAHSSVVHKLGAHNALMRGYESTPGVWLYDDAPSGITWAIFSDGLHKNPYKGTSYEMIAPVTLTDDGFLSAIQRLINLIGNN